MKRRNFIKAASVVALSSTLPFTQAMSPFEPKTATEKMPVLFVGHGSPMNAIEDNAYSRKWAELGRTLPTPKAIMVISAHWITPGQTMVTAMDSPPTIHDFGGFPQALFNAQYPAKGSPEFAKTTMSEVKKTSVLPDMEWGLDHGSWSVLLPMFPKAQFPVYQFSIDYSKPPEYHYQLAKELAGLRRKGVLIIGSGNVVHNLRMLRFGQPTFDWTIEFDEFIANNMLSGNHQAIVDFLKLGHLAKMAHPTHDHFLPLIYALALQDKTDNLEFFNSTYDMSSISMRSFVLS